MTEKPPIKSVFAHDTAIQATFPIFIKHLHQACESLQSAISSERWEDVKKVAHKAKGSAGSYGYPALVEVAKSLEDEANHGQRLSVGETLIKEFLEIVGRIEKAI